MIRDIRITDAGDLDLVLGDVVWLEHDDPEAVAQAIRHRLTSFLGDWYLDQRTGCPWFSLVLGRRGSVAQRHATDIARQAILDSPGVAEVLSADAQLDSTDRSISIAFRVRITTGAVYSSDDFARPFIVELR